MLLVGSMLRGWRMQKEAPVDMWGWRSTGRRSVVKWASHIGGTSTSESLIAVNLDHRAWRIFQGWADNRRSRLQLCGKSAHRSLCPQSASLLIASLSRYVLLTTVGESPSFPSKDYMTRGSLWLSLLQSHSVHGFHPAGGLKSYAFSLWFKVSRTTSFITSHGQSRNTIT